MANAAVIIVFGVGAVRDQDFAVWLYYAAIVFALQAAAFDAAHADLLIGRRTFGGAVVPWRSRFGNETTARVVRLLLRRDLAYRLEQLDFERKRWEQAAPLLPGGVFRRSVDPAIRTSSDTRRG